MDWYEHDAADRDRLAGRQFARGGPEQAAVGAAASILDSCAAGEEIGPLPELTSALVRDVITPYLGAAPVRPVPQTAV
jgi:hypothetical protein